MNIVQFLKAKVLQVSRNDLVRRVFHTFWQAGGGVLVATLLTAHSSADVKGAVVIAVAAGLAAVKALFVAKTAN